MCLYPLTPLVGWSIPTPPLYSVPYYDRPDFVLRAHQIQVVEAFALRY